MCAVRRQTTDGSTVLTYNSTWDSGEHWSKNIYREPDAACWLWDQAHAGRYTPMSFEMMNRQHESRMAYRCADVQSTETRSRHSKMHACHPFGVIDSNRSC